MALRSCAQLRSLLSCLRSSGTGKSSFATSTVPKMKPHASAAGHGHESGSKIWPIRAEFAPVYVAVGLIAMSVSFGVHTAVHQVKWAPGVRLKKSRRETVPEVMDPEGVAAESDNFMNNSFFRKVAHVQDYDRQEVMPNPISGDVYARKNRGRTETLKDVGVEPRKEELSPHSKHARVA